MYSLGAKCWRNVLFHKIWSFGFPMYVPVNADLFIEITDE